MQFSYITRHDVDVTDGNYETWITPIFIDNSSCFIRAPYAPPVNWNFKAGAAAASAKDRTASGKDAKHIDVDAVGTVNGVSIHEFDLDSVDDKPWRKPGKTC